MRCRILVSLRDNSASVEGRLSGSTDTFVEQARSVPWPQTHPRLDVHVIKREHRSKAAFVLLLTFNHKDAPEYNKSIV